MRRNILLFLADLLVFFTIFVFLNISLIPKAFAQTCGPWLSTSSSLQSCSNPLFNLNCNGSSNKTGTRCCTSNQVAGGPYDYCQDTIANPPAPQYKFRCCFNAPTSTPVPAPPPTITPIATPTVTPSPTPSPTA